MENKSISPDLLKTKQHFEVLDGLRGVAAIGIVIFHFMEMAIADFSKNFIGHGFLAVDFFFCLSGFVIGYAYDDRIKGMGITAFFKSRIIRLHPMVIVGSVLGILAFLFDPFGGNPGAYSIGKTVMIFITSLFMIPYPVIEERSFNNFGINAPAWSLFWEYIANIFYALILYRISRRNLWICIGLAAAILTYIAIKTGGITGGWAGANFWEGGARIFYSFLAGLLVYRANWIIKNKLGFTGMSVLLLAALMMPYSLNWNWLTELLVITLYFPLLVALGAGTSLNQGIKKICIFLGNISYPLYMTHYVVIWMFLNYYISHQPGTGKLAVIVITGTILLLAFAYLVMIFIDTPVRRYLTNKRKQ